MSEAEVMKRLDAIQAEIDNLKDRIVDTDFLLTEDDLDSIKEAEEDLRQGKTVRIA